jgi:FixJ family two-component response regulator
VDPISGAVFVIEDDPSMRRSLERQFRTAGFEVETFASAQDYLDRKPGAEVACIVTDLRMPGLSGLDLQASLAQADRALPMVFISAHGDIPAAVDAMRGGAVTFLRKPFTQEAIFAAVTEALARSAALARSRKENATLHARYRSLTAREREVFALAAAGILNKLIADRLGIAERTVKQHRGRVMEKMGAVSIADLVRMAERLDLRPASTPSPD